MRSARADIYRPDEVATVHTIATIVRKYFLLGDDALTRKDHSHRGLWITKQIEEQAQYFGIDVLGHAIMSNHFHSVLRSRPDIVQEWDDTEVARRWMLMCPKRKNKDKTPAEPNEKELDAIRTKPEKLKEIRLRLSDISWWMRILCQRVAKRANLELQETGRLFNGRFKAVRLLDDEAILACVSYVDLNPIRAQVAQTLEASQYTSVAQRFAALKQELAKSEPPPEGTQTQSPQFPAPSEDPALPQRLLPDAYLAPIELIDERGSQGSKPSKTKKRCSDKGVVPLSSMNYIQLLDATARIIREGKKGFTPEEVPPVLERLGLDPERWIDYTTHFSRMFSLAAGSVRSMKEARTLVTQRQIYCPRFQRPS
ncbi:hypothetical protein VN12_11950 [Pirellula sp. SH-Sr6A]|uniref:hypothetical protein n=1 Tax=Pirellula sp. SH-Sr6A TaxID=1632865 RepID=UPI00078BE163|nr:hypothetical protein [Pirellula sp. SH-Sr6A]AMV32830.1 hypothetical protein VN12_11950 [Pirellula sp. SH-Sr6A]